MGSKARVIAKTNGALNARDTNAKLDYIARAIAELAAFVDDLENRLQRIESSRR
jgi:hypothetical protein